MCWCLGVVLVVTLFACGLVVFNCWVDDLFGMLRFDWFVGCLVVVFVGFFLCLGVFACLIVLFLSVNDDLLHCCVCSLSFINLGNWFGVLCRFDLVILVTSLLLSC